MNFDKRGLLALVTDRASLGLLGLLGSVAILVPLLNLFVPESSPLHLSTYVVSLIGKYLCYAILAVAVDLIWGFCGILSLGHAAFFALGGYAMGMYLMRQIGTRGVYGHPVLPDFMVFLNWDELPWFWYGFDQFWIASLMVVLVPASLAGVFGWLAFRSRVTGVYFSIMTQALSYALLLAFFRKQRIYGFQGPARVRPAERRHACHAAGAHDADVSGELCGMSGDRGVQSRAGLSFYP